MTEIPATVADVDKTWLTEILKQSGRLSAENSVVSFSRVSHGAGHGYASEIERISVVYEHNELGVPSSIIAKFPTNSEQTRALATLFNLYSCEVMFYKELAPTANISAPECYWADIDKETLTEKITSYIANFLPEKFLLRMLDKLFERASTNSRRSVLLIEDLSSFRLGDQVLGCNYTDAESALRTLSKFQSTFWRLSFENNSWIQGGADKCVLQHGLFMKALPAFLKMFREVIDEDLSKRIDWLKINGIKLLQSCNRHPTLIHGDFRLDNLFFRDDGSDPILIDFQAVSKFNPMADVAYFLRPNLDDKTVGFELELVHFFWEGLNSNGVSDYTWEDCQNDYELAQWWLAHRGVIIIGLMEFSHPRGQLLIETAVRRGFRAGLSRPSFPW